MLSNSQIAARFEELADLLEIQGANPFRVRAYQQAARVVENLSDDLADLITQDNFDLTQLEGIGDDLAAKIRTLIETGTLPQLDELRQEVPKGVVQMLRIPGLGPKKVAALYKELKVNSLEDLKAAAENGKVAELKGFGKKTEQTILEGISMAVEAERRVSIGIARNAAEQIVGDLRALKSVTTCDVAGSCRRWKETCGALDVLAIAPEPTEAMDTLERHPLVEKVLARGDTKQRVRLVNGLELDLRVVSEESYGAALVYFTGSKEHNIVLRKRAQERGLKLNEYGLFREDEYVAGRTEEEVYRTLDLKWMPPELRENRGEIDRSAAGEVPDLVELADIKGDLHMHTTASDGTASIVEMAEAAKERGLKYIAITDHSQRVTMAHGLDAARLRAHWKEIDKARGKVSGIEILCGIECDILENGQLDLDDEVLSEADWVLAVLHYGLKQPRETIMKRLLNAVRNPHVDCIGHPSGRLVNHRPAADIDYDELFTAAAEHGVMMEINANPARLDLTDIHAASAKSRGIPIVIDTDAHSTQGMDVMVYGVHQARRAGLTKKDVANALTWPQFKKRLDSRG